METTEINPCKDKNQEIKYVINQIFSDDAHWGGVVGYI